MSVQKLWHSSHDSQTFVLLLRFNVIVLRFVCRVASAFSALTDTDCHIKMKQKKKLIELNLTQFIHSRQVQHSALSTQLSCIAFQISLLLLFSIKIR